MNFDVNKAIEEIAERGYTLQQTGMSPEDLVRLEAELKATTASHYTEENLAKHSVYLSDKTPTRVSNAMMIAQDHLIGSSLRSEGSLPAVQIIPSGIVLELLKFHDRVLGSMTGGPAVGVHSRSMLNFQEYFAGSKPVARHYDGEYLCYVKKSPTEFQLLEGLLPRYVMVFTIRNENVGEENEGTVLYEVATGKTVSPQSRPGMVLMFDNIRFRHEVPELKKPRLMCGLRNFDHMPMYFTSDSCSAPGEFELPDAQSPGYASPMNSIEAEALMLMYNENDWPEQWSKMKSEGAVF